ncbi:MAG: cell filamentation protein Fic, partial [Alphaproteobacteria bacterium]
MPQYSKDSEIILSTTQNRKSVAYGVETGNLRKLAPKLYTNNLDDEPEVIVKRNLWQIISLLIPNALIADRTAIELKPSSDGSIFIISERKRDIALAGIKIRTRKGHKPLPSDKPFLEGLFLSSFARSFLENMRISRPRKAEVSRTLSKEQLEEKLDAILRKSGEDELKKLRDEARKISKKLNLEKEQKKLDNLIG